MLECRHILDNEEDDSTKGDTGRTSHKGCGRSFRGVLDAAGVTVHGREMVWRRFL